PQASAASLETDTFLPTPARGRDAFLAEYHRTLGEYRYADPDANRYVYQPAAYPLERFARGRLVEREFEQQMTRILMNQDPFDGLSQQGRAGVQAQIEFNERFRTWKKNHDRFVMDREHLLGLENIYVFEGHDAIGAVAR